MPKFPDDMDKARELHSKNVAERKPIKSFAPTEEELAEFRQKHNLPPDAQVFLCRRGRR